MNRLYMGGLNYDVRSSDIRDFFEGCGRICDIAIKHGYGFVEFVSERDAKKAINKMGGRHLRGEPVRLEYAKRSDSHGPNSYRRPPNHLKRTEYRLIVKNLSFKCSWQALKDLMREAGDVAFCDVNTYRRGEGIVHFYKSRDMDRAMDMLDGKELFGHKIHLEIDRQSRNNGRRYERYSSSVKSRSSFSRSRSHSSSGRSSSDHRRRSVQRHSTSFSSRSESGKSRSSSRSPYRNRKSKKMNRKKDHRNRRSNSNENDSSSKRDRAASLSSNEGGNRYYRRSRNTRKSSDTSDNHRSTHNKNNNNSNNVEDADDETDMNCGDDGKKLKESRSHSNSIEQNNNRIDSHESRNDVHSPQFNSTKYRGHTRSMSSDRSERRSYERRKRSMTRSSSQSSNYSSKGPESIRSSTDRKTNRHSNDETIRMDEVE
ncbi:hypothetical protein SNEBB_007132 [Seison nebaliae]|nr:hypothetical protein SNEBB_007132 [Seison nebaliae]